ncbi:MAG TPA: right-handed parallel beta-helix repeat-containing protein [Pirellulales bacterium]|nr:right-handed parallel beta-helix repeat-containing protein [Pirellulales bacterium]
MRSPILALISLTLAGGAALGATVYVDNIAGDDLLDGAAAVSDAGSGPVRTLRKALRVAQRGDRIVLANTGEPYRETISLSDRRHSGTADSPFLIDGQGAVLEGADPVPPEAWENDRGAVFRFRPSRSSFQQLFLNGKPAIERKLDPAAHRLPELAPLEWYRRDAFIYFRVEQDKLPDAYALSYSARQTGITLYHVHDVVITNLVVQGFRLDGVNVNDGVRHCELIEVTSRGNGRSGVTVAGSSKVALANCVIGDNGAAQLRVEGESSTIVESSELIANTAPAFVIRGGKLVIDGKPAQ